MEDSPQPFLSTNIARLFELADRFLLFLARKPLYAVFFTIFLTLGLYGFGSNPAQDYFNMAGNPFQPYSRAPHFQDSLLLPLSAHWLGLANSQAAFELYTAIAFLLAFFAIFYFARRDLREAALFGALTLALSPASLTCLLWLGLPDQFIVLFSAILAFAVWPPALFVVTFLGVANHPLFLFVSLTLAGLRFFSGQKEFNWRQILSILLGAFSGYIFVQAFLSYYQIQIGVTRLGLMFQHDIIDWFLVKAIEAPLSIFSLYNGLWFVLAACVLYGFPRRKAYYSVFLIVQFGAAVITFFTYDTTRIFSLLTIGAVIHCVVFTYQLAVQNRHEIIFRRLMIVLFLAAIFLPHYLVWAGDLLYPRTYKLPGLLVNLLWGR